VSCLREGRLATGVITTYNDEGSTDACFLCLTPTHLLYVEGTTKAPPAGRQFDGSIPLADVHITPDPFRIDHDEHDATDAVSDIQRAMFRLTSPVKSMFVRCRTSYDKMEWVRAIDASRREWLRCNRHAADLDAFASDDADVLVRVPYAVASHCRKCHCSFLLRSRHHCRKCGQVFCNDCSVFRAALPGGDDDEHVRVCGACYDAIQLHWGLSDPSTSAP
jgi:hypothetical protein